MAMVTQPTERPGTYIQKFEAVKTQMLKKANIKAKFTEEEIEVMIKDSLIKEANDKIEFSLRGEIRRGKPAKMGVSEDEFSTTWKSKMRDRLKKDGYPFALTKEEKDLLATIVTKKQQEKAEELAKMTSEAMKKILSSIA